VEASATCVNGSEKAALAVNRTHYHPTK
jgi:hypothetical protein